jgi:hypothetical protein
VGFGLAVVPGGPISANLAAVLTDAVELPPLGRPSGRQGRHQFRRLDPERAREGLDRLQPHGPLAALDEADMGPVEPRGVRQSFLAEPEPLPSLPDSFPEFPDKRRSTHLDSVADPQTMMPQTKRNI